MPTRIAVLTVLLVLATPIGLGQGTYEVQVSVSQSARLHDVCHHLCPGATATVTVDPRGLPIPVVAADTLYPDSPAPSLVAKSESGSERTYTLVPTGNRITLHGLPGMEDDEGHLTASWLFQENHDSLHREAFPTYDNVEPAGRQVAGDGSAPDETWRAGIGAARVITETAPDVGYAIDTSEFNVTLSTEEGLAQDAATLTPAPPPLGPSPFPLATTAPRAPPDGPPPARPPPQGADHRAAPSDRAPPEKSAPDSRVLTSFVAGPPVSRLAQIAAAAAIVVGPFVAALYSLFRSKDLLKSKIRQDIYAAIQQNPGITVASLATLIGVRHQTISHHLQLLKKAGCVTSHQKGNKTLHFVVGSGVEEPDRELLSIDRGSGTMRVLLAILGDPSLIKSNVGLATGMTRTGAAWHVNKLVKLGLVTERKEGHHCRILPVPERIALLTRLHGGDLASPDAPAVAAHRERDATHGSADPA